ncbi:MAG TPA: Mur ligase domain-containing protein, partial [Candidatus Margulisiibacteriota bacterium]|nr:Mur ligase domain-containing protein [Candidatus Margulisiibacteriota bacterium]
MLEIRGIIRNTKARLTGGKADIQVEGICIDSRVIKAGEAFLALKGRNFNGHDFIGEAVKKGATCVITESKVRRQKNGVTYLLVKDTTRALGDIARYWRNKFNAPVIALTGSNGKTTAKEMLACLLSAKFKVLKNEGTKNNHIGVPLTLLKLNKSHEIAVL